MAVPLHHPDFQVLLIFLDPHTHAMEGDLLCHPCDDSDIRTRELCGPPGQERVSYLTAYAISGKSLSLSVHQTLTFTNRHRWSKMRRDVRVLQKMQVNACLSLNTAFKRHHHRLHYHHNCYGLGKCPQRY